MVTQEISPVTHNKAGERSADDPRLTLTRRPLQAVLYCALSADLWPELPPLSGRRCQLCGRDRKQDGGFGSRCAGAGGRSVKRSPGHSWLKGTNRLRALFGPNSASYERGPDGQGRGEVPSGAGPAESLSRNPTEKSCSFCGERRVFVLLISYVFISHFV